MTNGKALTPVEYANKLGRCRRDLIHVRQGIERNVSIKAFEDNPSHAKRTLLHVLDGWIAEVGSAQRLVASLQDVAPELRFVPEEEEGDE